MITLGVDPSSSSTGFALLNNTKLVGIDVWRPKDREVFSGLYSLNKFLRSSWICTRFDSCSIEKISVVRNLNAVRRISYVEGVIGSFAYEECSNVVQMNPTESRKIVFGVGNINKDCVYHEIISKYSHVDFLKFDKGGSDQSDAVVLGLALQVRSGLRSPFLN